MVRSSVRTFLSGLFVGAADLVPGISGGTVAFVIGVYEELIQSIASINAGAARLLFRGQFSAFFKAVRWQFLSLFLLGVACSVVTLAKSIQFCLNHETYRPFLYSAFMGLVVGSVIFCARLLSGFTLKTIVCLIAGALSAYFLSGTNASVSSAGSYSDGLFLDLWVVLCGCFAVSAMLLPGISGSYILNILGMYGTVLGALVTWVDALKIGVFDVPSFRIIASMVLGIACGAILFSRIVRYLLATYRTATLAVLVGFMVGALGSVWPFWTYAYNPITHKLQLIDPILPDVTSGLFALSCVFFAVGVSAVFLVESLAKQKTQCAG